MLALLAAIIPSLLKLGSGIIGGHHVQNIASGAPNALLGAVEGFSSRALLIVLGLMYATNSGCRAATNSWIASAAQAVIGG